MPENVGPGLVTCHLALVIGHLPAAKVGSGVGGHCLWFGAGGRGPVVKAFSNDGPVMDGAANEPNVTS